jgi:NAD(P)-dependent dehydrogenase (short-subunit alcohol dehydrogenase family)
MKYDLTNRTVALTGAAGGLGRDLAKALRTRGASVALLDLNADAVGDLAESLGDESVARGWKADVRDLDNLNEVMDEVAAHFEGLDVVVAAAGTGGPIGPIAGMAPGDWERTIDINLNGVWRTFKAALPHIAFQRGHLLAVASMASFVHSPLHSPYSASKAGVLGMCNSLRPELRQFGVTVGSAHPSFFRSLMVDEVLDNPVARNVWNDFGGLFKLVPRETVVDNIVAGIERRAEQIVVPRLSTPTAKLSGLFRPLVERFVFQDSRIMQAISHFATSIGSDDSELSPEESLAALHTRDRGDTHGSVTQ